MIMVSHDNGHGNGNDVSVACAWVGVYLILFFLMKVHTVYMNIIHKLRSIFIVYKTKGNERDFFFPQ